MVRRAQVVLGLAALVAVALVGVVGPEPGPARRLASGARQGDRRQGEARGRACSTSPASSGVGVGVNAAGKPVIQVYKEKHGRRRRPVDARRRRRRARRDRAHRAARAPTDRFPRPVPIGVSSGLADFATGTLGARVTDGTNVYALSNNHVFAGINTREHRRRRSSSRATSTAAATRPTGSATLADVPDDRLQRRQQHDGRGDRAHDRRRTSAPRRRPTATGRRAT